MSVERPILFWLVVIRLLGVAAVLATVVFVLHQAVGFGRQVIVDDFRRPARFVGDLKPVSRRDEARLVDGVWRTAVTQSPVMVDFKPLARFDTVAVTARLVPADASEVLLGALGTAVTQEFVVRPIYHAGLESLATAGWTVLTDGVRTLYQRKPVFADMAGFWKALPPQAKVATYFVPALSQVVIPGYEARPATADFIVHNVVLRGHHRLVTYVAGETLDTELVVQDMNRELGADKVEVLVYPWLGGSAVAHGVLADDGDVTDDQKALGLRSVRVTVPGLPAGAYQIELVTTDDVFVRAIRTRQSRLAILGRAFLGDYIGYSSVVPETSLVVDGSEVKVTVPHPDSGQTVLVNDENLVVGGGYGSAVARKLIGVTSAIRVPKNDVILETNGQLAFSVSGLVPGLPSQIGAMTTAADLNRWGVDYVLADYVPARVEGEVVEGTAKFVASELGRAEATGAFRFALDVEGSGGAVGRKEVTTTGFDLERIRFETDRRDQLGLLATFFGLGKLLTPKSVMSSDPPRTGRTYEKID